MRGQPGAPVSAETKRARGSDDAGGSDAGVDGGDVGKAQPRGSGPAANALYALMKAAAVLCVAFHVWLIFAGLLSNLVSRPLHIALALPFVFVFTSAPRSVLGRLIDGAWFLIGLVGCLYIALNHMALDDQYGRIANGWQMALGVGLLALALEMARRHVKWALPAVALLALLYGLFGDALPGELGHPGLPLESFIGTLVITEGGLWGQLTGVSVDVVAIFVILGAMIGAGEAGRGFMAAAVALAGRRRAGAAKVSVVASAMFGTISGSASANVASTGAVTLPAMKRLGYPAPMAGAVEAVASSGGQIMPPVMGAGAFIMVELLRTTYPQIMAAALLPAVLFFFAVWAGCDLYGRRYRLEPMRARDIPPLRDVAWLIAFFLTPFAVLLTLLFATGVTPQYAGASAAAVAAGLLLVDATLRASLSRWAWRLLEACEIAARQIAVIASIILCAGIVIGVLNLTGLGVKITSLIVGLSGGNLWVALALTGLACLILGMEVPTTAAYVICISVAGPALQDLGLPALHAHLFVFWYALLSTITPPVCGTVFIAAGMVGANWLRVAGHAMVLGIGLYLVPLAFIANRSLIMLADAPVMAVLAFIKIAAGLGLISMALVGGLAGSSSTPVRVALGAVGLVVIFAFGI